jgi:DNA-binding IclR family transcriptional regulator
MTRLTAVQNDVDLAADSIETGKDRQFVTALARGLSILRAFRCEDRVLGNQELATRTQLPKPTVSRLTYTLTELGYLNYNTEFGKYELGTSVLALSYPALANFDIRQVAKPHMRELSDANNVGAGLATPNRLSMVYIEYCSPPTLVTLRIDVGLCLPMIETATGLAYLAGLDDVERQRLIQRSRRRHGNVWPEHENRINTAREELAKRGFCIKIGAWDPDVNAVATPFVAPDGKETYVLSCAAPTFLADRDRLAEDIGPQLLAAAKRLSGDVSATGR